MEIRSGDSQVDRLDAAISSARPTNVRSGRDLNRSHAIGVDEPGEFRKACHKEYPPRLSAGIACAVAQQLQRNIRARAVRTTDHTATPLVQWINEVARECGHIRSEATWLPDYQG